MTTGYRPQPLGLSSGPADDDTGDDDRDYDKYEEEPPPA